MYSEDRKESEHAKRYYFDEFREIFETIHRVKEWTKNNETDILNEVSTSKRRNN